MIATPAIERDKLLSWRIFLAACEKEFQSCLKDLLRLPPNHRAHVEEFIEQLNTALRIVRDGPLPGERLPPLFKRRYGGIVDGSRR